MPLKYTLMFLMAIGIISFVSADAPCDGKPYEGPINCTDHQGKYVLEGTICVENTYFDQDGAQGVECIKSGYAFDTIDDCKEKCKNEYKPPRLNSPLDW